MLRLLYGDSPTARDLVLIHLTAVSAAGLLLLLYAQSAAPFSLAAAGVIVVLALDEAGGVVANATRSTSGWYRRQPAWVSIVFLAVHALQPALMALVLGLPWPVFALLYGYQLAAGCVLIRLREHDVQRPLAAALLGIGVVLFVGLSTVPPVLMILGLLYLVKLVVMFPVDHHAAQG